MIRRRWVLSLSLSVWAIALAACGRDGSAAAYEASLDAPIQLAPGQSAVLAAGKLEVEFTGIAADSRCPSDATCVWAGEVVARFVVRSDDETTQHEIREMQSATVGGYAITVLEVLPVRRSSQPIAAADYRVTLKIRR
jgi:hypothetical protein